MKPLSIALLMTVLAGASGLAIGAAGVDGPASSADATADRELVVRFARAYGMALGSAPDDEPEDALRHPESLDDDRRDELERIITDGGLSLEEWQGMFSRMDADAELRERIDSLSVPFRIR